MITKAHKEDILKMWNEYFSLDPTNLGQLERKFFLNPYVKQVEPLCNSKSFSLMCVQEKQFLYAPVSKEDAWIFAAAFRDVEEFRNLLQNQFESLRELGIKRIHYSNFSPGYFFPGLDTDAYPELFTELTRMGFKIESEALAMEAEIGSMKYEEEPIPKGVTVENLREEDTDELLALIENNFPADCYKRANDVIISGDREQITVAKVENEIVGYSMYSAGEGKLEFSPGERLGCFEIIERARSKGIGSKLLAKTLINMKSNGIRHAYFLWTSEKASHIYQRFGFKTFRKFSLMTKQL